MRNVRNLRFSSWAVPDKGTITAACWDPDTDSVLCTIGPSAQSSSVELVRLAAADESTTIASWDAPSTAPDELPVDRVISLHHLGGSATTCLIFEGGDIVTLTGLDRIEIVGSIDAGITAAAWSPDEELLAVMTKADTLVLMGASFDPIVDVSLSPNDISASKHVSVGWGHKETQFQGRGAKALRDPTIPEKVDQGLPSSYEDGATTISWRGDGAYLAVNSAQNTSRRVVRVYSREGELDSASEPLDGLEAALSWRPAGNLIAGIQRLEDGVQIVFFERNGLRHGQFSLRCPSSSEESPHSKIRLQWNSDSTVLGVFFGSSVQLWTMGNYHWYLKQEIATGNDLDSVSWHPDKPLRFAAVTQTSILVAEYVFDTVRASCRSPHDSGIVAVVDGQTLKLTPFRMANVPPPMSLFDVALESPLIDVVFGPQSASLVAMHNKGINFYHMPLENGRHSRPDLKTQLLFSAVDSAKGFVPLRVCCVSEDRFRCIGYRPGSGFLHFDFDVDAGCLNLIEDKRPLLSTTTHEDGHSTQGYGQDASGNIYKLTVRDSVPLPISFPLHLACFEMCTLQDEVTAIGLSRNGHLYANSRLLAKNCTSFVMTPRHVVFTTSNHLVKFVHLDSQVQDLEIPADDVDKDERCRSVERGSRLVVAIPSNMTLVLQMPRGNLETISPRAMVVAGIRSLIEEKNYGQAFSYCRTQRVDMNILYDHRPTQFLASTGLFLDQIKQVTWIDLFLSSLREEDVTKTMYQDTRRESHPADAAVSGADGPGPADASGSKVNAICDGLLKELQCRKATHLQNIITAHVCKVPPALDDGLVLVADIMRQDEKLAEKAIEHVCFLVDINRVYDHAIGLYNLELALLVAQQSQRDPREYVPFIQNLHALPEQRRKFAIDDHLARRSKALGHLKSLDAFDELCSYTTKHGLYQDALGLFRYDEPRLRALTGLYADHLESKSSFHEAGLAYESLGNWTKATSCYRAAGASCWQECLFAAQQQSPPLSTNAMTDLASTLADALWEAKDFGAAATIHLDYLGSLETAVRCLCKGSLFADAMRLVVQRGRPELLSTALDSGLTDALGTTTEFLADCRAQLQAQVPRVIELRHRAAQDPLAFYEGERAHADVPDDVSIAPSSRLSTSASLFTRYTGGGANLSTVASGVSRATSKNRRREEKKRARGRKGTVYEEEYLVNSLRRLVERVATATTDVERLVAALVRRNMAERARAVEGLLASVVECCERAVEHVFVPASLARSGEEQQQEPGASHDAWRPTGGDAVLQDWIQTRSNRLEPPLIKQVQKLSLLG
ncbi:hypothetical protein CDD82_4174 [Ophiocordyceps australis]|uniref:Elongator complex protein 1 n=1 Tax=Ophiocordyceps australis TaxID=1399860 RepID=A0A2C5ZSJ0_9HYPO|nr:hypothetical protein CDD82_4174 [Ophiocordyceps australis]